jgi:hypothetical protein
MCAVEQRESNEELLEICISHPNAIDLIRNSLQFHQKRIRVLFDIKCFSVLARSLSCPMTAVLRIYCETRFGATRITYQAKQNRPSVVLKEETLDVLAGGIQGIKTRSQVMTSPSRYFDVCLWRRVLKGLVQPDGKNPDGQDGILKIRN